MKVRRKPESRIVLDAIQFRAGQPLPEGMHPADPRSEDQSPVLEQPDGAPSMGDGDWILVYPSGERWRCAQEDFEESYEEAIVEEEADLIQKLRTRLDLLEPLYEIARSWHTAPDRREADANFANLGAAVDLVLEAKQTPTATVLTEVHDFQRFENALLNRTGGRVTRHLKIVCRCGWSDSSLEINGLFPDEATTQATLDRLNAHIGETRARRIA